MGTMRLVTAAASAEVFPEPLPHQHEWRLVAVEYDDLLVVRELHCSACESTRYE